MTQGFQHQDGALNFAVPKPAALPQHGQKADPQAKLVNSRRAKEVRPRP